MASRMVGRTACPECGFSGAHVKESEKCLYRYCPECGSQHHARTPRQRADLEAKTRPIEGSPTPSPTPTGKPAPEPSPTGSDPEPTPTPTATPPAPPERKRSALFGF